MTQGVAVCERLSRKGICLIETCKYYTRREKEKGAGELRWPENVPIALCDEHAKERKPVFILNLFYQKRIKRMRLEKYKSMSDDFLTVFHNGADAGEMERINIELHKLEKAIGVITNYDIVERVVFLKYVSYLRKV
jgi:hypothetical protein